MTAILRLNNDYSWLITDNIDLREQLWKRLRFRERNYFHNRRYKARLWDGYTDFFHRIQGRFLTGLLPEVTCCLKRWNIAYTIEDERNRIEFRHNHITKKYLGQDITLHDYQVDLVQSVIRNHRGVVLAPTGSGKTLVLIGILKAIPPGTPTLILQNRISLAQQNYDEICRWGFKNVGTLWGGANQPNVITVASVQSVVKIEKLLPNIKVLIVDEIHDMMSKVPKAVYRRMKAASVRVAMSATPFKFGETDNCQKFYVKGFFGPVLKILAAEGGVLTTKELQDRDILSQSRCTFYPVSEPDLPYDIYIDAVTHGIAENYEFHRTVTRLATRQTGRTLILVERLAHGDALAHMIPGAIWVQGKDTAATRKAVIRKLQKSKDDVVAIATQQIFNTGINFHVHNLINAAGGQADHLIIQRVGRGLRTAEDKEILSYYDFIFTGNSYLLEHSQKRVRILREQGHEIVEKSTIDF